MGIDAFGYQIFHFISVFVSDTVLAQPPLWLLWAVWWRLGQGWGGQSWQAHLLLSGLDGQHQLFLNVASLGSCLDENAEHISSLSCWHYAIMHTTKRDGEEKQGVVVHLWSLRPRSLTNVKSRKSYNQSWPTSSFTFLSTHVLNTALLFIGRETLLCLFMQKVFLYNLCRKSNFKPTGNAFAFKSESLK